jgi:hypothetical protein
VPTAEKYLFLGEFQEVLSNEGLHILSLGIRENPERASEMKTVATVLQPTELTVFKSEIGPAEWFQTHLL